MDESSMEMGEVNFTLRRSKIQQLFDTYQNRKYDDDIVKLEQIGGPSAIENGVKSSFEDGLDFDDREAIRNRINYYSTNEKPKLDDVSFCALILESLEDTFIQILIVAAIVQIGIGASPLSENPSKDWIDGIAIVFAIVVVCLTTAVTNYNKEKKFNELSNLSDDLAQVTVLRNKKVQTITSADILVGDIIKLEYGMIIPADGLLFQGNDIVIDESSITGESDVVTKENLENCLRERDRVDEDTLRNNPHLARVLPSPFLFSGTIVKSGSGWFIALAVGKNSAGGKIQGEIIQAGEESKKTPLQLKLEDISEDIGKFGLWSAILTFVVLVGKLVYSKSEQYMYLKQQEETFNASMNSTETQNNITFSNRSHDNHTEYHTDPNVIWKGIHKEILTILLLCVSIIVVAIPEGLPLAVTLSLSFSVKKMMEDNNLVRQMAACETMGGANFILSDKTGTITQNRMTVQSVYNNNSKVDLTHLCNTDKIESPYTFFTDKYYTLLKECILSNSDIEINADGNQTAGSKTDYALYKLMVNFGENYRDEKRKLNISGKIDFTSQRKKMTSIVKKSDSDCRIYMKGAQEKVIAACKHYVNPLTGEKQVLNTNELNKILDNVKSYEMSMHRCIALAYKDFELSAATNYKYGRKDSLGNYEIEEEGFTLIGVAAISDTIKSSVPRSVELCNISGISVVMITGDNIDTAVAIAKNVNIIKDNDDFVALTGADFYSRIGGLVCRNCDAGISQCKCPKTRAEAMMRNVDPEKLQYPVVANINELKKISLKLKVLARARPHDKFALVVGLRELDYVVSVTGDGTNDAPALSKSDVGFAMGIQGTDVAKQAADIIILDDNFSSIVSSIKWGRNIFDNIRKFIQFQLSVNLSAVFLVFVSSCIGSESPICAIQMLWINLIMDSLGSLALATEAPTDDLLYRKPYSKREYIINPIMWKHILAQSIIQFSIVLFLYLYAEKFIIEEEPSRIFTIQQLENCFGEFSAEVIQYEQNSALYYILDGKKSSWHALHHIKPNLSPEYCMFYDTSKFVPGSIRNMSDAYRWYMANYGNTTHMTLIFNCFVFYSLFNQINCRIIDDHINIFRRLGNSILFIVVTVVEIGCQILFVQYGGLIFKCAVGGLTLYQWFVCIGFASITIVVSIFMKFLPLENCGNKKVDLHNYGSADMKESLVKLENSGDMIDSAVKKASIRD